MKADGPTSRLTFILLSRNKVEGLTVADCKSYYRGTAINSASSWRKDKRAIVNGMVFFIPFWIVHCKYIEIQLIFAC